MGEHLRSILLATYSGVTMNRCSRPEHRKVLAPVGEYFLGSDGVRGSPEPSLDTRTPRPEHVIAKAFAHDQVDQLHLFAAEALDAPEIQEAHAPVLVEDVVAGVRVGVEQAEAFVGAVDEAPDRLRPLVAQLLPGGEGIAPGPAPHELLGQHATGAQLTDHIWNVDERMSAVVLGKLGLVGRLEAVVELLGDARADLTRRAAQVKAEPPSETCRRQSSSEMWPAARCSSGLLRSRPPRPDTGS